jgi:TonB family protein
VLLDARVVSAGPRRTPVPGFEMAGLELRDGAEFHQDGLLIRARLVESPEPLPALDLRQLPFLALGLAAGGLALFAAFLLALPSQGPTSDFTARDLSPVAVRLIAPAPQLRQEATRAAEQIREHVRRKKPETSQPRPKAIVAKHFAALAKLTAAGPAMKSLLAQMDKRGGARKGSFKLTPILGRDSLVGQSSASLFDLGHGGIPGAEVLHGKGGGGVGAMGAGTIGRGAVSGTVSRATAQSLVSHGDLAREALAEVINLHLQAVRGCYERALLKAPALTGKLVVEWTVTASGRVTGAKVKSKTLDSAQVESCVLQQIVSWQFPKPEGGPVQVTYPFVFTSAGF